MNAGFLFFFISTCTAFRFMIQSSCGDHGADSSTAAFAHLICCLYHRRVLWYKSQKRKIITKVPFFFFFLPFIYPHKYAVRSPTSLQHFLLQTYWWDGGAEQHWADRGADATAERTGSSSPKLQPYKLSLLGIYWQQSGCILVRPHSKVTKI